MLHQVFLLEWSTKAGQEWQENHNYHLNLHCVILSTLGKAINQQEMNAGGILKNISKAHTAQHDQ